MITVDSWSKKNLAHLRCNWWWTERNQTSPQSPAQCQTCGLPGSDSFLQEEWTESGSRLKQINLYQVKAITNLNRKLIKCKQASKNFTVKAPKPTHSITYNYIKLLRTEWKFMYSIMDHISATFWQYCSKVGVLIHSTWCHQPPQCPIVKLLWTQ